MSGTQEQNVKHNLRLEWVDPTTLNENPANWRRHPEAQLHGVKDAIDEVGWAGALLYNEATERLIDGHARKRIFNNGVNEVPVLIGSWTEEQERIILATLDPLAAMAKGDEVALQNLIDNIETDSKWLISTVESALSEAQTDTAFIEELTEASGKVAERKKRGAAASADDNGSGTNGVQFVTVSFALPSDKRDILISQLNQVSAEHAVETLGEALCIMLEI